MESSKKKPSLLQALTPILVLIVLLFVTVQFLWGDDALAGGNQMSLIFATVTAALIGWRLKYTWKEMLDGITHSIGTALPAAIILLLIGALAGTWLISGIVPTMIFYGLKILNPTIFLFSACLISAIISLATGSSWSTIATVGVALLGIGQALGIHVGLCAGAIISGAYFGDKMSPMSDTTNLAPAVAGTDLFTHIRYMLYTTIPSISITLIIFLIIGFFVGESQEVNQVDAILASIEGSFNITPWLFIVPAVVIVLIIKKVAAIPALFVGVVLGGIFAPIFQRDIIKNHGHLDFAWIEGENADNYSYKWTQDGEMKSNNSSLPRQSGGEYTLEVYENGSIISESNFRMPLSPEASTNEFMVLGGANEQIKSLGISIEAYKNSTFMAGYKTIVDAMTTDMSVETGNADVDDLLSTSGMYGMLNTIWLIIVAMSFGGIMDRLGFLSTITEVLVAKAQSRGGLIMTTALTCIGFNVTASDQYLAIVVPGKMYSRTFRKRGLAAQNLSRTLEDAGTVTSVLIPWNTCGAAQSKVLGIATGDYWMYCFFNLISPLMTILFGFLGIKIAKTEENLTEKKVSATS